MGSNNFKIDFVVKVKGNEELFEDYVQAVFDGKCQCSDIYLHPFMLEGHKNCSNSRLVEYFLQRVPFNCEQAVTFFDKVRRISKESFSCFSYELQKWVERKIEKQFFTRKGDYGPVQFKEVEYSVNPQYLMFLCHIGLLFARYGASYQKSTATEYFHFAKLLGSKEPERLKREGSGELPQEVTHLETAEVKCFANDAFGTITLFLKDESESAHRQSLEFLCTLLRDGRFPRSFSLQFKGVPKIFLPIKGIKKHSINAFFASAARFSSLHPLMECYARNAICEFEWYANLEAENCAMPGTFAVLALGLSGEHYFDLVCDYMDECDDEHSSVQGKFASAMFETFGITPDTLRVLVHCAGSMQEHPVIKNLAKQMADEEKLRMLLDCRPEAVKLAKTACGEDDDLEEMTYIYWSNVTNAIWGDFRKFPDIIKKSNPALRGLYQEILKYCG